MTTASQGMAIMRRLGIGNTLLVPLPGVVRRGRVVLKAEYANPFGSVKDRTAAYLLAWSWEVAGPKVRVVESTSGNLGVALAKIGSSLGIRPTLVMDASLPTDRISEVMKAGADVEFVGEARPGMTLRETRIAVASELGQRPGHLWLNQYANPAGVQAHEESTGTEILAACAGHIDAVVASVGTGGTICGIGVALRQASDVQLVVGVEPVGSTISGGDDGDYLPAGSGMRGPPDIVKQHGAVIDCFAQVPDTLAAYWALRVRRLFDIAVGQTTGAAVAVATALAERDDLYVVAIAPDSGLAFLPAMRRLGAQSPDVTSRERVRWQSFGSDRGIAL